MVPFYSKKYWSPFVALKYLTTWNTRSNTILPYLGICKKRTSEFLSKQGVKLILCRIIYFYLLYNRVQKQSHNICHKLQICCFVATLPISEWQHFWPVAACHVSCQPVTPCCKIQHWHLSWSLPKPVLIEYQQLIWYRHSLQYFQVFHEKDNMHENFLNSKIIPRHQNYYYSKSSSKLDVM